MQEPNESGASFGLRVQSLRNSIVNTIDQDPSILDHHRKILKKIAIKNAREHFLCGLKPELEAASRAQRPELLIHAINFAVQTEGNRGFRDNKLRNAKINYVFANSDNICAFCNK